MSLVSALIMFVTFWCCDKIPEKNTGGQICLGSWFQVSVHGQVVPLLWACGELEHHGGESGSRGHSGAELLDSWQPRSKETEWGGPGTRHALQGYGSSNLLLPTRPLVLVSTTCQ